MPPFTKKVRLEGTNRLLEEGGVEVHAVRRYREEVQLLLLRGVDNADRFHSGHT
jgi:hypothetical protein